MGERVFTIFEGRAAGRTFVLAAEAITLGREEGRDVVLDDDRVSRLHARLVARGERVLIVDEGSSNGTFVNGALVNEREIHEGDVIAIGTHKIVYGTEAPPPEKAAGAAAPGVVMESAVFGEPTRILPTPPAPGEAVRAEAHLTEILEAVADAAQARAERRGIHISVEQDLDPDIVEVEANRLYQGLASLLADLMEVLPRCEGTLALRSGSDPFRDGFKIELICVGVPIPREKIRSLDRRGRFVGALYAAIAHEGALEILPKDSPDTVARMRLPFGRSIASAPTVVESC